MLKVHSHDFPLLVVPELSSQRDAGAIKRAVAAEVRGAEGATDTVVRILCAVRVDKTRFSTTKCSVMRTWCLTLDDLRGVVAFLLHSQS